MVLGGQNMNKTRSILLVISALFSVLLMAGCNGGGFSSTNAVTDFTLPDGEGQEFTLSDELQDHEAAVLVFYQSYT